MRVFLISVVAAVVIAGGAAVVLESLDMSSARVYSSSTARH